MPDKLAILTIHGMGETKPDYWTDLYEQLEKRIKAATWDQIYFKSVYYQDVFQENQSLLWSRMPDDMMDWAWLRRFLLFGFSDAAALERKPDQRESAYVKVQVKIRDALQDCISGLDHLKRPVAILAHSLGCQVLSNYIWDSQKEQRIWNHHPLEGQGPDTDHGQFLRLGTLQLLLTTGCNIPIFVAGIRPIESFDREKLGDRFRWYNFFDKDDVLGWPLRPMSESYSTTVTQDILIESGGLINRHTPMSHNAYWQDADFLASAAEKISELYDIAISQSE